MAKTLNDLFSDLDEMNKEGGLLADNTLSQVDDWIDTGSYALNAIISGSVHKGVPNGRITGFSGPSGCGKTLITMKIVGNFLKKDPSNWAIIFDSEIAVDKQTAEALGVDPSRVRHYPVNTVKDTRNQVLKALNTIIDNDLRGRFIIVIDSLGNLAGDKEVKDATEGALASDMGTRAKDIKSMLRVLTYHAAKAKTAILFTNHVYNNPTEMYPNAIKTQSGGEGPIYMASVLVQLGSKAEKNEKDFESEEILPIAKNVGGITMHALTAKNRFVPPWLKTDLYLNFKTGLDRYSGLFKMAKEFNVITGDKTYDIGTTKLGYRKDFERDPKIWDSLILPALENKLKSEITFQKGD